MTTVLLVVHLMVASALVAVVLWQRSEGGALGIGGGGGFLTGRGTANLLTRTTAILAACFFVTSIALTLIGQRAPQGSILDRTPASTNSAAPAPATPAAPGTTTPAPDAPRGGILDKLK